MGHLGGCELNDFGDTNSYVPETWDKLIEDYKPKKIIDVGCGGGYSLKYFLEKNIDGVGVEGFEEAIEKSKFIMSKISDDMINDILKEF
jgi:2-polyprenyl-3-methyl-5-hydroxy-6-metoxy-1,4-benzoquinol methylase